MPALTNNAVDEPAAGRLTRVSRLARTSFKRMASAARRRSLIGEILALQLVFAAVVGILALTGLWWASSWVIDDNMRKWGEQWLANLDELGMPLYVSDDNDKYVQIESYVDKFSEISFVRYYSESGEPIFSEFPSEIDPKVAPLDPSVLGELARKFHRPYRNRPLSVA